jgi:MFS family permease
MSPGSRIFLSGQAVSLLGDGLAILAIPLLVLQLTGSPLAAALASSPRTIGYLVVGLPSGPIADRLNPWFLLITMDTLRAAIFAALYVLTAAGVRSAWLILGLAFVSGGAGVFFDSALTIAVRDVFADGALVQANSLLEMASQTSVVLGPAIVGVLASGLGVNLTLLIDAATYVVSLVTLFTVSRRRTRAAPPTGLPAGSWRKLWPEFKSGLSYVIHTRVIFTLTVVQMMINLCLSVEKLTVFFARDALGLTAFLVGVAVAGGGVGGVVGAVTTRRIVTRLGALRLVTLSVALIGISLAFMSAAIDAWWLAAGNLTLVWATIVASIVIRTLRQEIVPRYLLGRVTSTVRTIYLAVTPIGAVLAGVLTSALGNNPRPVFLGAGIFILITAASAWPAVFRHAQFSSPATHEPSNRR